MSDLLSPDVLNKAVHDTLDQAIAAIPNGKRNALLIDGTVNKDGPNFQAMWVHKVNDTWHIAVQGAYDGPHGMEGKVTSALYW